MDLPRRSSPNRRVSDPQAQPCREGVGENNAANRKSYVSEGGMGSFMIVPG